EAQDPSVRDAAARSLARLEAAATPLVKALCGSESPDQIRVLAAILRHHGGKIAPALREKLRERATELMTKNDPLAEPVLEALRQMDPKGYVELLAER